MSSETIRVIDLLLHAVQIKGDHPYQNKPSLAELVSRLGHRSFGVVLVLFGLPNLLPVPGLPIVCGLVVGVIAYQMLRGAQTLLLPQWLGKQRFSRQDFEKIIHRATPLLRRLETIMKPRYFFYVEGEGAQRFLGLMLLLQSLALMTPVPFFGGILPGLAVILFGLALAERDGVFVWIGLLVGILAFVVNFFLTYVILRESLLALIRVFGVF